MLSMTEQQRIRTGGTYVPELVYTMRTPCPPAPPAPVCPPPSQDLTATTVFNDALLGEMGGGEMADTSVHSNWFSRLLGGGLPALRTLSLNIAEPLNAPMKRALRQLSGLTELKLRCADEEDEEEREGEEEGERAPRQHGPTADCKLLEGMTALQVGGAWGQGRPWLGGSITCAVQCMPAAELVCVPCSPCGRICNPPHVELRSLLFHWWHAVLLPSTGVMPQR